MKEEEAKKEAEETEKKLKKGLSKKDTSQDVLAKG